MCPQTTQVTKKASLLSPAFPSSHLSNLVDLNLPLLPSQLSMCPYSIPVAGRSHLFGTQHTPIAAKMSGWLTRKSCKPLQHPNSQISVHPCSHCSNLYVQELVQWHQKANFVVISLALKSPHYPSRPMPTHVAITTLYLSSANPCRHQSHPCGPQQPYVAQ